MRFCCSINRPSGVWVIYFMCWDKYSNSSVVFQLQPSAGSSSSPTSPAAATPPSVGEVTQPSAAKPPTSDAHPASEPKSQPPAPSPSQHSLPSSEEPIKDASAALGGAAVTTSAPISDRQSPSTPQPARTPGSEDARSETTERTDGVAE